ncbi:MAG: class I SAM-dependent methyltransferase [Planctomycetes bacterium]|nr:class I SAM-dependent methyltransferase [Planctomycetota bacterium]
MTAADETRSPRGTDNARSAGGAPCWYDTAFDAEYLLIYRHRDLECARGESSFAASVLALRSGERVLDLGCGAGRHLQGLAGRGLALAGIDRSAALLACARAALPPAVALVRGDMRSLPFRGGALDSVLSFFTSFGYFATDAENALVLVEIARVLRDGGRFMLDLLDRDYVCARLVAQSVRREGEWTIRERRALSPDGTRVEKEITIAAEVCADAAAAARTFHESVRLYGKDEIEPALARAGLAIQETYGDFDAAPYRPGATPRMILCGRRERRQ